MSSLVLRLLKIKTDAIFFILHVELFILTDGKRPHGYNGELNRKQCQFL